MRMVYIITKKSANFAPNIWAVLIGVPSNPWRTLNWFRATDGLSGHEFTVGAAPLAVLSRLFIASSST
jgi:hypothetical protein